MGWMDGEVVLVTGGGSGLGAAIARRCHSEGAHVVVLELMAEKVRQLQDEFGDAWLVVQGDVTSANDLARCRELIVERHGRLDALIGVQGIWDGNRRLIDMLPAEIDRAFDEVFSVNVKGFILSARTFADMLARSGGSITLTASNAAFSADGGGVLYTASKHAVIGVVRQLAFELAPAIRVNGIAPNGIKGSDLRGPKSLGLAADSQADRPADAFEDFVTRLVPLQRLSSAEAYTSLYVTLASLRHATVMTGEVILADQGMAVRGLYARP